MAERDICIMGKIGASHGVRGWVKVHPSTETVEALLDYEAWWIGDGKTWQPVTREGARVQGKHLVVKFKDTETPEAAALLTHQLIGVLRTAMPALEEGEFYWADLEGLTVVTEAGETLGQITRLFATGANDVMVVKGDKERLIPFVRPEVVKEVDRAAGRLVVDWDPQF